MSIVKNTASALAKAVGIYQSQTAKSQDIAAEISTLLAGQQQRQAALAAAEEERRLAVLSGNAAKATSAENTLAAARRENEHAAILIDGLRERLASAEAAEAEAVRQERYDRALAMHKAIVKDMPGALHRMRADARTLVQKLSEAQDLIEDANADLPSGAIPLDDPDLIVRGRMGAPEEIVDDRPVKMWCWEGTTRRIPDHRVPDVIPHGGDDKGYISDNGTVMRVEKRPFRRIRYRAPVPHDQPNPIQRDLAYLLAPQQPLAKADREILERFNPA